jgi:hypothetical protein
MKVVTAIQIIVGAVVLGITTTANYSPLVIASSVLAAVWLTLAVSSTFSWWIKVDKKTLAESQGAKPQTAKTKPEPAAPDLQYAQRHVDAQRRPVRSTTQQRFNVYADDTAEDATVVVVQHAVVTVDKFARKRYDEYEDLATTSVCHKGNAPTVIACADPCNSHRSSSSDHHSQQDCGSDRDDD